MLFTIAICYYELLLACYYAIAIMLLVAISCYCYLINILCYYLAIIYAIRKNTMTENELKDYIKSNKISISDLRYFMECTTQTLRKRINEISMFSGKDLHILIDFGVPFDIIRKRIKRLYNNKLASKQ